MEIEVWSVTPEPNVESYQEEQSDCHDHVENNNEGRMNVRSISQTEVESGGHTKHHPKQTIACRRHYFSQVILHLWIPTPLVTIALHFK